MSSSIYIGRCRLGRGVFARQRVPQAEAILRFHGPVITAQEVVAKGEHSFNALQVGPGIYLDLEEPGVCLNHSCEPNAGIVDDIVLVALRDIAADEEITFDYSTSMSENLETMRCHCGSTVCRGIVGDFHDLAPALKDRYLAARLVQSFIVGEHREKQQRRPERSILHLAQPVSPGGHAEFDMAEPASLLQRRCA